MAESVGSVIAQLVSCYPNVQVTDATIGMYIRLLKDIPPAELQVVVDQAVAESEFLPTIARLRDMHRKLGDITKPTAVDGWDAVQKAIRKTGSYGKPTFDDPITARVVDAMGWLNLCMSEDSMADRAHFLKMYAQLAERQDGLDKLLPQARRLAVGKMQEQGLLPIGKLLGVKDGQV